VLPYLADQTERGAARPDRRGPQLFLNVSRTHATPAASTTAAVVHVSPFVLRGNRARMEPEPGQSSKNLFSNSAMTRRRWIADEVSGNRATLVGSHAEHLSRVLSGEARTRIRYLNPPKGYAEDELST